MDAHFRRRIIHHIDLHQHIDTLRKYTDPQIKQVLTMLPVPDFIRPIVKKAVGIPARVIPYSAQKQVLSIVLNQAFREPLKNGELDFLEGAKVRIKVTDLCIDWLINVGSNEFTAVERELAADVCISGESPDFMMLAIRRADPDTLFFQRRIRIEGDTELGLGVKNTMDSMDWEDLPFPLRKLLQSVSLVIEKLQKITQKDDS